MVLLLAFKACDNPQDHSLPFRESHLALNLGGAHKGIVTHVGALEAFDML
jgi:hypothetical protein